MDNSPLFSRRPLWRCVLLATILTGAVKAEPVVDLTLQVDSPGSTIPADFSGLSYETRDVLPEPNGQHLFRADNRPLIAMMQTLGIRSLRLGGNTVDLPSLPLPSEADLDSLFAFTRAAGLKVIFTLRLRQGDPSVAATEAHFLMTHYGADILCFAIGNEPDIYDRTYPAYLADLKKYIGVITRPGIAPTAKFAGPSTTPDKADWARSLAVDFGARHLSLITQHEYPGGSARAVKVPAQAIDAMLSTKWLSDYGEFYSSFAPAVRSANLPYRLEETNNYYHGGVQGASDTFGAALWALDYMHWWAAHDAAGLNFHTGDWVAAADEMTRCRYAAFRTSSKGYEVMPVGYALKAFSLGGRGRIIPTRILSNPADVNITAYAVKTPEGHVMVTLVNKEHGPGRRAVSVHLAPGVVRSEVRVALLTSPGGDVATATGLRLGNAAIDDDGSWHGEWTSLPVTDAGKAFEFHLPPATAAILSIQ